MGVWIWLKVYVNDGIWITNGVLIWDKKNKMGWY